MSGIEILVAIKPVPDHEAMIEVRQDGSIEIEPRWVMNFFDEVALEQAVRMKETSGAKVTAICAAPTGGAAAERSTAILRKALAMGADKAVLVPLPPQRSAAESLGYAIADGLTTARVIAAFAGSRWIQVVFCGRSALDDEQGLVGPAISQLLGWAYEGGVVSLEQVGGSVLRLKRIEEGGYEVVDVNLPVVIGAVKGLCEPRVPKVMSIMKASKAKPEVIDPASLGIEGEMLAPTFSITRWSAPPRRKPTRIIEWKGRQTATEVARLLKELVGTR